MHILFYPNQINSIGKKIEQIFFAEKESEKLQIINSIEKLTARLHEPIRNLQLIVLLPENKDDLLALLLMREKMMDISLILILPNQSKEIIAMGHKLFPRFISFQDSNLSDVTGVIHRILHNHSGMD